MYYPALRLDPSQIWTSYKYPPSESHGFEPALLQQFCSEEIDVEGEDDTWFEGGLARVFDPYYDLEAADVRYVDACGHVPCYVTLCSVLLIRQLVLTTIAAIIINTAITTAGIKTLSRYNFL